MLDIQAKKQELYNVRHFEGNIPEEARKIESSLKLRYSIQDWKDENGMLGYKIFDKKQQKEIYFDGNARKTLEKRYLEKDRRRNVTENVLDLFARVAVNIADADLKYNPNVNIESTAESFLESLVHKEFMPNTPTLCNAGRALQQLSACFVLPVDDYMATDDLGNDPDKQGEGIYDTLRFMSMIHKSGGGTGFNFSHLRPRGNLISTTFGTSSGPVPFIKSYDAGTIAVNQGGFRRGANMGILYYSHPDIFEFIAEKAMNGTIENFNLSVGLDEEFMRLVESNGYFKMVNPKDEKTVPLEERVWKEDNLLHKSHPSFEEDKKELIPSIYISEGNVVVNAYTQEEVGKVNESGEILISAKKLFDYIAKYAWEEGCPGIIFLDRLEQNNKTPHVGKIEATNPCGEQPLLPYEACNLGAVNLSTCVRDGQVDFDEIERRVYQGIHFLDNVIDKSKFPFQKIYGMVHGNRKVGLGMMGWAEMLSQLDISYDSPEALELAGEMSKFVTNKAREKSIELAKERGVFPFWEGSYWQKEGIEIRNATNTTIAPNGTTAMIAGCTGGIEPYFKIAFSKTCMDQTKLIYRNQALMAEIRERFAEDPKGLEKIIRKIDETGSLSNIEEIPEDIKKRYRTSHEIPPEFHVKMQAAFQSGIDNAVSKTVNLPQTATEEDIKKIFKFSYDSGCMGITVFRDGSKTGVLGGIEKRIELVQQSVDLDPRISIRDQAIKYKIKRLNNQDSLHVIITSDLYVDDKNNKAYFIPVEDFQERAPLGDSSSVSFQQSGIDRTEILKGPNPDYIRLIKRWQSASSNEEEGIGPNKVKSKEHAVGLIFEDHLLGNGIVGYEEMPDGRRQLVQKVWKKDLRKIERGTKEWDEIMSQVKVVHSDENLQVMGNHGKLGKKFTCEMCGSDKYTFIAGCNHPTCMDCGNTEGGGCG